MKTSSNNLKDTESQRKPINGFSRVAILFALCCFAVLMSGCFTSEYPFYQEKQIVQDDRITGTYEDKQDGSSWFVSRSEDAPGKYRLILADGGSATSEYTGTLFRLDKILYMDIFPLSDSGMRHDAGGPPTASEVLHLTLYERRHLVMKVELSETNCLFWIPSAKGIANAAKIAPELKAKSGAVGPVITFSSKTEVVQDYLRRFGTNTLVFDQKGQMAKTIK